MAGVAAREPEFIPNWRGFCRVAVVRRFARDGISKSGAYASVSEVVRDGVRALLERDAAVERWLREEVVPGHQEYLRDAAKGVPADAILRRIKARRAARKKQ
jgi:antitoxin ParD1/3/4